MKCIIKKTKYKIIFKKIDRWIVFSNIIPQYYLHKKIKRSKQIIFTKKDDICVYV